MVAASEAPGFVPAERPRIAIASDGTLAAIAESSRVVVLEIPGAAPFAEVSVSTKALATEIGWVGAPPRLVLLSRYEAHSTVQLIDPYGPRTIAEIRMEAPMKLLATVGAHALAVSSTAASILTATDTQLTPFQVPARAVPTAAGGAAGNFVVALGGSVEEWDPQARMPTRRLRLARPAVITGVGGNDRVVWLTTQQDPARLDVIPLVDRGQPKSHDLPEIIAQAVGHPRSDLVVCIGAQTGKLFVVDTDGRSKLRTLTIEGIGRSEAAALVIGRMNGVLAAQATRPVVLVTLDPPTPVAPADAEAEPPAESRPARKTMPPPPPPSSKSKLGDPVETVGGGDVAPAEPRPARKTTPPPPPPSSKSKQGLGESQLDDLLKSLGATSGATPTAAERPKRAETFGSIDVDFGGDSDPEGVVDRDRAPSEPPLAPNPPAAVTSAAPNPPAAVTSASSPPAAVASTASPAPSSPRAAAPSAPSPSYASASGSTASPSPPPAAAPSALSPSPAAASGPMASPSSPPAVASPASSVPSPSHAAASGPMVSPSSSPAAASGPMASPSSSPAAAVASPASSVPSPLHASASGSTASPSLSPSRAAAAPSPAPVSPAVTSTLYGDSYDPPEPLTSTLYGDPDEAVEVRSSLDELETTESAAAGLSAWREKMRQAQARSEYVTPLPSNDRGPSWRDDVVMWTRGVFSSIERAVPEAPPIVELAARFDLPPELVPALVLLYGAHLAGERGAAPVDVARVLGRSWDEALGTGQLAERGLARYADSRVRLAGPLQRALDGVPCTTGTLVGESGAITLLGPCVVVDTSSRLAFVASRCLSRVGGAILAAHDDADPGELFIEARARGAAAMLRVSDGDIVELGSDPAVLVVSDESVAEQLGVPRLY